MPDRVMKVRDVAREYGVTHQTVYNWLRRGALVAMSLPGGDYRFRREDLDAFEARCRGASSTNQTTGSGAEAESGPSTGPSPVALDPFQRGRLSVAPPRDGETNG